MSSESLPAPQLRDLFRHESQELLSQAERATLTLETAPSDAAACNELFRAVHTIKGSAGIIGLKDVTGFAHRFESVLAHLRDGKLRPSPDIVDLVLQATDHLRALLLASDGGAEVSNGDEIAHALDAALAEFKGPDERARRGVEPSAPGSPSATALRTYRIRFQPDDTCFIQGHEPRLVIEALAELGELETVADTSRLPDLTSFDPTLCYLAWNLTLRAACERSVLEDIFVFTMESVTIDLVDEASSDAPSRAQPSEVSAENRERDTLRKSPEPTPADQFLRVHVEKVDALVDLVGEITLAYARLAHEACSALDADGKGTHLASLLKRLQDESLALRTVRVGGTFSRMKRLVRDLSRQLNKPVQLETLGEETEIDRSVAEAIHDPLVHLIRNSIDHGLESQAERESAGKGAVGRVTLEAQQSGGEIRISVRDDGRGLDRARILARARERGLCGASEEPDNQRVWMFIFEPGFSTSDAVTAVSGRGVGMDVVRTNVEAIRGRVTTRSWPGRGTEFVLHVPLTLAIVDALLVRIARTLFAVPIESVIEIVQPGAYHILPGATEGTEILRLREALVPVLRLQDFYALPSQREESSPLPLLALESVGAAVAIPADEILGQQQIVIKPLTGYLKHVRAASGCAVLGSGEVAVVLDTTQLTHSRAVAS